MSGENFEVIHSGRGLRDYTLDQWVDVCHGTSVTCGWWDHSDPNDMAVMATKIALIHSEVSEMLEGLRKGHADAHLPDRSAEEVEAADVFIRLMDYCGARNLDLAGAVVEKMAYNKTRVDHSREARAQPGGKAF